jgi:hypothetical protein
MTERPADNLIRNGQHVRIRESWYQVVCRLPRPLVDEDGNTVDLLMDRFGAIEYGRQSDVDEIAPDVPSFVAFDFE